MSTAQRRQRGFMRNVRRLARIAIGCAAVGAVVAPAGAQAVNGRAAGAPYSAVTVAVSAAHDAHSGKLEEYWDAGTGVRLDVHMPFHIGEAGITATTLRHASRGADQPGFRAIVVGANWRFPLGTAPRVRPAVALEAGNFMTVFDGEQPKGLGKESEIYVGGALSLAAVVTGGTSLVIGADARHVFTSTPLRLVSLHAGVAHAFGTPRWLRAVIE